MTLFSHIPLSAAGLSLPLFLLSTAPAQEAPAMRAPATASEAAAARPAAADTDRLLAAWAQAGSRVLVATANAAEQRCQDPRVRELATDLQQKHGKCLEALAGFSGLQPRMAIALDDQGKPKTMPKAEEAIAKDTMAKAAKVEQASAKAGKAHDFDHVALLQELCAKHIAMANGMLAEKQGKDVDRCFLVMQTMCHHRNIATNEVLAERASPKLAELLRKDIETLRQETQRIEKLMAGLHGADGAHGGKGAKQDDAGGGQ